MAFEQGERVNVRSIAGMESGEVVAQSGDQVLVRIRGKLRRVALSRVFKMRSAMVTGYQATHTPSYERPELRAVHKDPPGRDAAYLAYVRGHACMSCAMPPNSDAHHWGGSKGMGMKCDDRRTVPLCRKCHDHFHSHGTLPGENALATRFAFMSKQVELLAAWVERIGRKVDRGLDDAGESSGPQQRADG